MRRIYWLPIFLLAVLSVGIWFSRPPLFGGKEPLLFTAAGQVTDLAVAGNGAIWAATRGGVVCWPDGKATPDHWDTACGLPANEVRAVAAGSEGAWVAGAANLSLISPSNEVTPCPLPEAGEIRDVLIERGTCRVATSNGVYRWEKGQFIRDLACNAWRLVAREDGAWVITDRNLVRLHDNKRWPLPDIQGNITALAAGDMGIYLATALGCWIFDGNGWREIPLPAESLASHISALEIDGEGLLAGLYDDGLYRWDGKHWSRIPDTPAAFRHITSLSARLVGTQEEGLWESTNKGWQRRKMPAAIPATDIYGITAFRGVLWAATFDQGLLYREGNAWQQVDSESGLSSDSPRDLVVFRNRLYVRYSTGEVDCFDGRAWRPAFDKVSLPRQGVYAMATDSRQLYLGQWAGWAATDGKRWEHHFKEPALQGQVITAIAAGKDTLWLGTQKAGLFAWRDGRLTQYHESHGLTDDWITSIGIRGDRVLVGTYTGGLLQCDGKRFAQSMDTGGFAVRDIAFIEGGKALVATPLGVYREEGAGWRALEPRACGGLETQTLYPTNKGVWIGSRTALAYMPITE